MEDQRTATDQLDWLPKISKLDMAFGTTSGMPEKAPAMAAYKHDAGGYSKFAQNVMFNGLEAMLCVIEEEAGATRVISRDDHRRVSNWISASIASYELKHEHKIGGIALRLKDSFVGIAYLLPESNDWLIAGHIDREDLPPVDEVREALESDQSG